MENILCSLDPKYIVSESCTIKLILHINSHLPSTNRTLPRQIDEPLFYKEPNYLGQIVYLVGFNWKKSVILIHSFFYKHHFLLTDFGLFRVHDAYFLSIIMLSNFGGLELWCLFSNLRNFHRKNVVVKIIHHFQISGSCQPIIVEFLQCFM